METKFKESKIRTSSLEELKGNFLAERVLRSWNEDFIDEDTKEVVTIQRNEILFDKGTLVDNDTLSEINFYLQSGDIKDVLVSNQQRKGTAVKQMPSCYSITINQCQQKSFYGIRVGSCIRSRLSLV